MSADDSLPDDVIILKAMLRAERAARLAAEAEAQQRVRRGNPEDDEDRCTAE